jgi:anaerobic selenocysteine-containing dehydrogenase
VRATADAASRARRDVLRSAADLVRTVRGHDETSREAFPLSAITQRPMYMYHAWGSQNAWLRQIQTRNALYVHPATGAKYGSPTATGPMSIRTTARSP